MSVATLAQEHHRAIADLSVLIGRDVSALFRRGSGLSARAATSLLLEAVPALGEVYGEMAGALAVDFYDEVRETADVPGRFVASPAVPPERSRLEVLVRWGVEPLFIDTPKPDLAVSRVTGGMTKVVADVSRETVLTNTARDPKATGWSRIARADGCAFCRLLASKGNYYKDVRARFASHDRCGCTAAPAFSPGTEVSVLQYQASKRKSTPAQRERLRAYLRAHH